MKMRWLEKIWRNKKSASVLIIVSGGALNDVIQTTFMSRDFQHDLEPCLQEIKITDYFMHRKKKTYPTNHH